MVDFINMIGEVIVIGWLIYIFYFGGGYVKIIWFLGMLEWFGCVYIFLGFLKINIYELIDLIFVIVDWILIKYVVR